MTHSAVITGDFVASGTRAPGALDAAMRALGQAADAMATWAGGPLHFTRNRGDGWQVCLAAPRHDLRATLVMRAVLRRDAPGWETRAALARGSVTLGAGDLNSAAGPAFVASGRALDGLARPALWAHADGGALAAATRLADHLSQGWTRAQARALAPMLVPDPPTHATVAEALGISRQAVSQALDAAGFDAIATALALIETEA